MSWTAVVPLKQGPDRKTRLAGRLSGAERLALSEAMAAHVLACLKDSPAIARIILLSPVRPLDPALDWRLDAGRGLNAELTALRAELSDGGMLIIHGDLPLLTVADVEALIKAAEAGRLAIAPDAHGTGTNALAIPQPLVRDFAFAFGLNSCALHIAGTDMAVRIERQGLAIDVDTPDDLGRAIVAGMIVEQRYKIRK